MKKLMNDGVLSQEEFVEQKEIILQALCDLYISTFSYQV